MKKVNNLVHHFYLNRSQPKEKKAAHIGGPCGSRIKGFYFLSGKKRAKLNPVLSADVLPLPLDFVGERLLRSGNLP